MDKAKLNKRYKIVGFAGEETKILRRFFELGFSKGISIKVVAMSIQKKVFLIEIRGYILSVKKSLLKQILVN